MPAAGLGEAFDQGIGLGVEENQVQVDLAPPGSRQITGQFGRASRRCAHRC
jgi:hypothetical protein